MIDFLKSIKYNEKRKETNFALFSIYWIIFYEGVVLCIHLSVRIIPGC